MLRIYAPTAFFPLAFLSRTFAPALGLSLLKTALALANAALAKSGRYPFFAVELTIDLAIFRFDLYGAYVVETIFLAGEEPVLSAEALVITTMPLPVEAGWMPIAL
jgi:hypothetical protein